MPTYREVRFRRTRSIVTMCRKRREGQLQHCPLSYDQVHCLHPPSVKCYSVQAFSVASDFDSKLMHEEQNQIMMRKVWMTRESPHTSHPETVAKHCLQRAAWVRCRPSTLRRDSKMDELACSSRRCSQLFLLNHCCSEDIHTCLPGLLCNSS